MTMLEVGGQQKRLKIKPEVLDLLTDQANRILRLRILFHQQIPPRSRSFRLHGFLDRAEGEEKSGNHRE
jgi:hypothetical protein